MPPGPPTPRSVFCSLADDAVSVDGTVTPFCPKTARASPRSSGTDGGPRPGPASTTLPPGGGFRAQVCLPRPRERGRRLEGPERRDRRTRASGDSAEHRPQTTPDASVAANKVFFNSRGLGQGPSPEHSTCTARDKAPSSLRAMLWPAASATAPGGCFLPCSPVFHLFKRTRESAGPASAPVWLTLVFLPPDSVSEHEHGNPGPRRPPSRLRPPGSGHRHWEHNPRRPCSPQALGRHPEPFCAPWGSASSWWVEQSCVSP